MAIQSSYFALSSPLGGCGQYLPVSGELNLRFLTLLLIIKDDTDCSVQMYQFLMIIGCHYRLTKFPVALASRIAATAADAIALLVTWHATFSTVKEARRAGIRTSLSVLLLRDGMFMSSLYDLSYIFVKEPAILCAFMHS